MKMFLKFFLLFFCTLFLSSCSSNNYDVGYSDGYDDGFDFACTIIIDSMDPEYREQWWQENIDDIMKYGIEY